MKHKLAMAAAMGAVTAACAQPGPPPTAEEVIAAFRAKDWTKLKAITSSRDVYVRPDGGAPQTIGWIPRDDLFSRMRDCVVAYAFLKGEYQPKNGVEMICPKESAGTKPCVKLAYGITFEIVGDKAVFDPVFHTTDQDRVACPSNGYAPPPPAPPLPPQRR